MKSWRVKAEDCRRRVKGTALRSCTFVEKHAWTEETSDGGRAAELFLKTCWMLGLPSPLKIEQRKCEKWRPKFDFFSAFFPFIFRLLFVSFTRCLLKKSLMNLLKVSTPTGFNFQASTTSTSLILNFDDWFNFLPAKNKNRECSFDFPNHFFDFLQIYSFYFLWEATLVLR